MATTAPLLPGICSCNFHARINCTSAAPADRKLPITHQDGFQVQKIKKAFSGKMKRGDCIFYWLLEIHTHFLPFEMKSGDQVDLLYDNDQTDLNVFVWEFFASGPLTANGHLRSLKRERTLRIIPLCFRRWQYYYMKEAHSLRASPWPHC